MVIIIDVITTITVYYLLYIIHYYWEFLNLRDPGPQRASDIQNQRALESDI